MVADLELPPSIGENYLGGLPVGGDCVATILTRASTSSGKYDLAVKHARHCLVEDASFPWCVGAGSSVNWQSRSPTSATPDMKEEMNALGVRGERLDACTGKAPRQETRYQRRRSAGSTRVNPVPSMAVLSDRCSTDDGGGDAYWRRYRESSRSAAAGAQHRVQSSRRAPIEDNGNDA